MSKLMKYRVVREHIGFAEGTTRTAREDEVKHLVPHVLELIGPAEEPAEKAEAEPLNKAEPAPLNKAEVVVSATKAVSQRASKRK